MTPLPTRLVIADDDPDLRSALRDLIVADEDLELVGEAVDAASAAAVCASSRPDVVVLDVAMPGGGEAAARQIATTTPAPILVALSGHDDMASRRKMFDAGVHAYLVKGIRGRELLATIKTLAQAPPDDPAGDHRTADRGRADPGARVTRLERGLGDALEAPADGST